MGNDFILSFKFLIDLVLKKNELFYKKIKAVQRPTRRTGGDAVPGAVHKKIGLSFEMKTNWPNQLKISKILKDICYYTCPMPPKFPESNCKLIICKHVVRTRL